MSSTLRSRSGARIQGAMLTSATIGGVRALLVAVVLVSAPALADPPKGELYQTVATHKSRVEMSAFLVARAQKAAKARDWAHAIPLYQALVVARGPGGPEQKELATLWTLAGQNEEASKAWASYADAITDEKDKADAIAESTRLHGAPDPFADK